MATISIASDKGGPGKTTTAILVGAELALDGYTVGIIDTDLNQQAAAFVTKAQIPGLSVYADVLEENVLPTLKKA
jgi:chromosome partitioning protein